MTTADVLMEQALALAGSGAQSDEAVRELLARSEDRRVAVVRARQQVLQRLEGEPDQPSLTRAVELLDEVLDRIPV